MQGVSVLLRSIGGVDDKRAVLAAGCIARKLTFGSAWSSLRIGIRACLTDSGLSLDGIPRLAIGVSSGITNIFGDENTTNWCGAATQSVALWTRTAAAGPSPTYYYNGVGSFYPAKRVGATITYGATALNPILLAAQPADGYRKMILLDITKGAPDYTFRTLYTITAAGDVSQADFLATIEETPPSFTDYSQSTPRTLAVSEAAGAFDSVNVSWDRDSAKLEISDLVIKQLA